MKLPRKIDKLISDEISVYKLYVSYYFNGSFMLVPSLAPITGTGRSGPVHLLRHSARLKSVIDLEEWNSMEQHRLPMWIGRTQVVHVTLVLVHISRPLTLPICIYIYR